MSSKDIRWNDIDWLKANHVRLYYFGLGFIQLKLDETFRLHFYTPKLPSITEDIHNHRYWFRSTVLRGEITNRFYRIADGDTHVIRNETCNPEIDAPADERPCSVSLVETRTIRAGEFYYLSDNLFHTVEADSCITLLQRSPYTREFAQVVTPAGEVTVCPFSKQVPEDTLWEIIKASIS